MSNFVKIVEVGPRDGLQNEKQSISTDVKLKLIASLKSAGLSCIEAGAFVSPKAVPQMATSLDVLKALDLNDDVEYPVLVPNMRGMESAVEVGVKEIAVFTAASESFLQKNINCSLDESFERFKPVFEEAKMHGMKVRGYVSCIAGCPYEGDVPVEKVVQVAKRLYDMGAYEISLGDTIGVGTADQIKSIITEVSKVVPVEKIAAHFHDTYGQALANIYAAIQCGVRTVDSSVAGLGGCPYAPGAAGNVATEDVVYMLNGMGLETGVDIQKIVDTAWMISEQLGRYPVSKVAKAMKE